MRLNLVLRTSFVISLFPLFAFANETLTAPTLNNRSPAVIESLEPDLDHMDLTTKDLPGYTDEELAGIQEVLERAENAAEKTVVNSDVE